MTRNNDIDMRDYRTTVLNAVIIATFTSLVYLTAFALKNDIGDASVLYCVGVWLIVSLIAMWLADMISTPMQRLAKHDHYNGHKDNDIYNTCQEYKEMYDSLEKSESDRKAKESKKIACEKAVRERFK